MEPNELQTVHYKRTYHQHCFVKLIRENAERETARPSEAPITGAVPLRFA
jgi:hypothetical protein